MHRYRYEADPAEQEPLDNPNASYNSPGCSHPQGSGQYYPQHEPRQQRHHPQHFQPYYDPQSQSRPEQQPPHYRQEPYNAGYNSSAPRAAVGARRPNAPPTDQSVDHRRAERRLSRDQQVWGAQSSYLAGNAAATLPNTELVSPLSPPEPTGRGDDGRYRGREAAYSRPPVAMQTHPKSNVTPGSDNFSDAAAGGMAGIAYQVAERNARDSGLEAMRGADPQQPNYPEQAYQVSHEQQYGRGNGAYDQQQHYNGARPTAYGAEGTDRGSHSSLAGLGAAAIPPANSTPGARTPSRSPQSQRDPVYTDDPYSGYSRPNQPALGVVDPHDIYDDGDDGLEYGRRSHRASMLSLGAASNRSGNNGAAAIAGAGAAAGAIGGGVALGRAAANARTGGYGPVNNVGGGGGGGVGSQEEAHDLGAEKSAHWGRKPAGKSKKWKVVIIAVVAILIVTAIVMGVSFGVVFKRGGDGSGGVGSGQSAEDDVAQNGDLNADSAEIKALMNNANLHKVFMGMDYTPLNTQFPDCEKSPPSQNNVTRDVAVLSQLTNTIRLYGTDCNQTQMVLHAINQLKLGSTVKLWLGVWQDKNETTNARQLRQMWEILDEYGASPFKGLIVANEILFRQEMSSTQLQTLLGEVRANLTSKNINLPVATSDLGDDWKNPSLAQASDYIMANIHPFFGGVPATEAAAWTVTFWNNVVKQNEKSDKNKNVIAEFGWPSQGGKRCPPDAGTNCATPAVAGVSELNQVLQDWVCPALNNGTNYFWFSAFDEPWKIRFNTKDENWEDHWGLMDVERNLKSGLKIPDCGGKTVS